MRTVLLLLLLVAPACGEPMPDPNGLRPDGGPADAAADAAPDGHLGDTTEASGRTWCEDGTIYGAQLIDLANPGPEACATTDENRWRRPPEPILDCEHGCAIPDGGTGCESCYGHDGGPPDCGQHTWLCAP